MIWRNFSVSRCFLKLTFSSMLTSSVLELKLMRYVRRPSEILRISAINWRIYFSLSWFNKNHLYLYTGKFWWWAYHNTNWFNKIAEVKLSLATNFYQFYAVMIFSCSLLFIVFVVRIIIRWTGVLIINVVTYLLIGKILIGLITIVSICLDERKEVS